ncbi:MAG: 5'-methylthioadenosine/adenosylhomocysteine nucleosidase [Muribaculum sp.]|nr:5'-methylthioadenosine/adenosylhomocysteine nucleosidase [Muribaculum sp.]
MNKIGIIGAMELEVSTLQSKMTNVTVTQKAGMEFHEGILNGTSAVVVRCGIGKVNAALCVQILSDLFAVSHIINTGVAGSLNAELDIGDILISRDALHHDMDVTALGYEQGQVPQMDCLAFPADAGLMEAAKTSCESVCGDIHALYGRVVSGDQFIADGAVKEKLISVFQGDCAEMEGAAIAHGAYLNGIPFVIIRAISDKADGSAEMDYPQFERASAERCARLVEDMIAHIR